MSRRAPLPVPARALSLLSKVVLSNVMLSKAMPSKAIVASAILLSATLLSVLTPQPASAQEFAAVVSPPRFEDRVKPGATYRNVIEIANVSAKTARFSLHTADWTLDATGAPVFTQALSADSCRPWVGIEAADISVAGGGKRRYRFEVAVPADAPVGECRFAIMIEGEPQPPREGMPLPMSGRIGVIVYLSIGDAAPSLTILDTRIVEIQGMPLPTLRVHNSGNMHARLEGYLAGIDAKGTKLILVPDNSPILVGAIRDIPLYPQADDQGDTAPPAIVYPLRIRGRLDADRQRLSVETTLSR